LGPHLLGHGLLNRAVREIRAYLVQVVVLGEPVLATFWAWAFLGERPSATLPVGGGLVVAGVIWALRGKRGVARFVPRGKSGPITPPGSAKQEES
jgi:drug/metabolite transporter (DMT)-like permease